MFDTFIFEEEMKWNEMKWNETSFLFRIRNLKL